jgi:glycosyltransferase involved in cell wall biosynthesis
VGPFFSIVIPSYNRKGFISTPIESCLSQSFNDFEILIIDDGSTDGTTAFLQSTYAHEPRIKVIPVENGERGRARNIGFNSSTGSYVIFLDSDDEFLPDALHVFHITIVENPGISILCGKYYLNDGIARTPGPLAMFSAGTHKRSVLLQGNPFACNVLVNKLMTPYFSFQEERKYSSMEDWLFLLENTQHHDIHLIDSFTVSMNDHEQRSMRNDHLKVVKAREEATEYASNLEGLNEGEVKTLQAHSHYFCAIHAYLGSMRSIAYSHIYSSFKKGGPIKALLILSIKVTVGRSFILKLSRAHA